MHPLLERLKQRKVVQWALAYVASAVALYSALDAFSEPWGVGDLQLRITQVSLLAGFFIAVALAWYHGERGEQRVTGVELLILAGIMGLGALGIRLVAFGGIIDPIGEQALVERTITMQGMASDHVYNGDFEMGMAGFVYTATSPELGRHRRYRRWTSDRSVAVANAVEGGPNMISPDGRELAEVVAGQLRVIPLPDGPITVLAEDSVSGGISWGTDGYLYVRGVDRTVHRVPRDGSEPMSPVGVVLEPGETGVGGLAMAPSGRLAVLSVQGAEYWLHVLDLRDGSRSRLIRGRGPHLVRTGHLVFTDAEGRIAAAPIDLRTLELEGSPVPVVETGIVIAGGAFRLSVDGTLAYYRPIRGSSLQWIDNYGRRQPLDPTWTSFTSGPGANPFSVSPDGRKLAIRMDTGRGMNIWVKDMTDTVPPTPITNSPHEDRAPVWSSDGDWIYFLSARTDGTSRDVYKVRSDGTGEPELVYDHDEDLAELALGPADRVLFIRTLPPGTIVDRDILALDLETGTVSAFAAEPNVTERHPRLSPSGRFLAYQSNRSGPAQVYIRDLIDQDSRPVLVSRGGGRAPNWGRTDGELFFQSGDFMTVARLGTGTEVRVESYEQLWPMPDDLGIYFYVGPDGRMLGLESSRDELVLKFGWFEELKRLVPN